MITNDRMRQLARDLLVKVRAGMVRWGLDLTEDFGHAIYLQDGVIRIVGTDPEVDEAGERRMIVEDKYANELGEWVVRPGEAGWDTLDQLYRAGVLANDNRFNVVDSIEAAIRSPEVIVGR